eukprot:788840-Amphidinium_carterae.1
MRLAVKYLCVCVQDIDLSMCGAITGGTEAVVLYILLRCAALQSSPRNHVVDFFFKQFIYK